MLPRASRVFVRLQHAGNGGGNYQAKLNRLVETARSHIDGLTGVREVEMLKQKVCCREIES